VECGYVSLLGAPLFPGVALYTAWGDRCEDLTKAVDRLSATGSQDALILLRSSFCTPKLLYRILRCCPSADHPSLSEFDRLPKHYVQPITNSSLSEIQWIQASLPVRGGGLGIRSAISLALPAFVASAASTLSLQSGVLAAYAFSNNNFLQTYLSTWSSQFADVPEVLQPNSHSGTDLVCWRIRHW